MNPTDSGERPGRDVLTPSQLNTLARDLLEGAFPLIWVEGELSGVSRPGSGHLYFCLKDARAQVRCAMFKPKSTWLKFVPREGMHVLARGRLTLYEARGEYQLVLDHMEEAGEGALRRAHRQVALAQHLEGRGRSVLQQVPVDVQQDLAVVPRADDVPRPDLLEQGMGVHSSFAPEALTMPS